APDRWPGSSRTRSDARSRAGSPSSRPDRSIAPRSLLAPHARVHRPWRDSVESPDLYDDPFEVHFRREPVKGAGVQVVVLSEGDPAGVEEIGRGIVALLAKGGRKAEATVEPSQYDGRGACLEQALRASSLPLVLVTTASEPWTEAHLAPLLE